MTAGVIFSLTACSNDENQVEHSGDTGMDHSEMDHSHMDHSSSGEVSDTLKNAESPTYEVGDKAFIEEGHMAQMNGVEVTIVGAYDTTVYAVSYNPTDGSERVENHEWVIHEELDTVTENPFGIGDEVLLVASHMEGMQGASAEIDSVQQTTVYMVDFKSATDGSDITNHKWVTESELTSVE
ncbi:hypothetical protein AB990_14150 [Alkalihalobacillus pseudalcaliphilus]|nr:hypothetical protein AB990_14150 [Alkalihalobacillus pseudalcaliphilus]